MFRTKPLFVCVISIISFLLIASCKTNPDYGSGPITLSPSISKYYKNKYLNENRPWMFFVNKKGTMASYLKCDAADCTEEYYHGIKSCEKRSEGEKCYIFDEWQTVVWNGPVTWDSHAKTIQSDEDKLFLKVREGTSSAIWYNGESTPTVRIIGSNKYYNQLHERLLENENTDIRFAFLWQDKRKKTKKFDYDWTKPVSIKAVKEGFKRYFRVSHPSLKQLRSPSKPVLMFGITDMNQGMWHADMTKSVE